MHATPSEGPPLSRWEVGGLVAVLATVPWVVTWPLLPRFFTHVMAAADQEAAPHIWGLWAAAQTGGALQLDTTLQGFPDGVDLVLVDPLNVLPFQLGLLGGVASAYNTVLLTGVLTMGLAGAALARVAGGSPVLGSVVAMACPTLIANAADGMTEGFGVGMVGLAVAALLRTRQRPQSRWWIAGGLLVGLTAWAGPYNAVWTALVGLALAVAAAIQRRGGQLVGLFKAGLVGIFVALPVIAAIFGARDEALPGSGSRAGLPDIVNNPEIFRGGVQTGADLLDPWLPVLLTGGQADVSHTAYLGAVVLVSALWAVWQAPHKRWPWLAGALAFAALSLGPWLYLGGTALRVGDAALAAPAGLLTLAFPVMGRLTRWYRAGAVATLMLAPLTSTTVRQPAWMIALCAALIADTLLLAPLAWPLHHTPLPAGSPLQDLPDQGAFLELPPVTSAQPPPGMWRDENVLLQVMHGHPVGGSMMGLGVSPLARDGVEGLRELMRGQGFDASLLEELRAQGFRWVVIHTDFHPLPASSETRLRECLGQPVVHADRHRVWDLSVVPMEHRCSPSGAWP